MKIDIFKIINQVLLVGRAVREWGNDLVGLAGGCVQVIGLVNCLV